VALLTWTWLLTPNVHTEPKIIQTGWEKNKTIDKTVMIEIKRSLFFKTRKVDMSMWTTLQIHSAPLATPKPIRNLGIHICTGHRDRKTTPIINDGIAIELDKTSESNLKLEMYRTATIPPTLKNRK